MMLEREGVEEWRAHDRQGWAEASYAQGHADGRADVAEVLRERAEGLRSIARASPNSEGAKRALKAAEELSRVANRVVKKKWRGR